MKCLKTLPEIVLYIPERANFWNPPRIFCVSEYYRIAITRNRTQTIPLRSDKTGLITNY